jgi:UDP:flavonoid glycosyltransferase YjiC (YdhE family)
LRALIGVTGLAGHTLPAIALARELRARGHEVLFCGFERWRATVEGLGIGFEGGPDRIAASIEGAEPSLADSVRGLLPQIERFAPDVVVSDGLTLSPALAAEVRGIRRATLLPEVYPFAAPGRPFFSLGLLPPRTTLGAVAWRAAAPLRARLPSTAWLRRSRRTLARQRAELGLAPPGELERPSGDGLTMVATLPQLEYPRAWPAGVHVTGPMFFDPQRPSAELPGGDRPLVVVAPSTVKDPEGRLVRIALDALAAEPVRVLVTTGGAEREAGPVPANALLAEWIDYSRVMREAALVICHGNHGTVARALSEGVPVLVSPAMADDAEHGARVAWAGAGLMIPRPLLGAAALRSVTRRLLADGRFAERAEEIGAWARDNDGARLGADLVEGHADGR